jgi:hypothetical protein
MANSTRNNLKNSTFKLKAVFSGMFLLAVMLSCISYRNLEFQALRPAQIKLGTGIGEIDIHCEFCPNPRAIFQLDTLQQPDARVALYFLQSLRENLEKSPVFQNTRFSMVSSDSLLVLIKDYKIRSKENGLVILLDSIFLNDTIITQKIRYQSSSYLYGIIHKFGCRTYNKSTMQVVNNYLMEDTLFWPPQPTIWLLDSNIPDAEEARRETGIKGGEAYAHYLAPYWTDQSRYFYYGNKQFNLSYKYIQESNLDSALSTLKQNNTKKSKNASMMNLHNMAIVYELRDDMVNAYAMADSSYKLKKTELTKAYIEKLRIRKLDKAALDWQLN